MNLYKTLTGAVDFQLGKKFSPGELSRIQQGIHHHANIACAAEYHGVAPFFYQFIKEHNLDVPTKTKREFLSLIIRHRHAADIRAKIISEILHCFDKYNIDLILLKGIALAYTIYTHPQYRPMRDIDVLVPESRLAAAKSALVDMGFVFDDAQPSIYMGNVHHLPNAVRAEDGLDISLELHHQVYSRDNSVRLGFEQAWKNARPIKIHNRNRAFTLDHISMLDHLCRHTFGPADEVRLIHQFEILKYLHVFINEIPWSKLHNEHSFIVNTIRCLHFSLALPAQIKQKIDIPETTRLQGVGQSFLPYSKVLATHQTFLSRIAALFPPSAWWMHVIYNIPPEKTLLCCYLYQHPKRLVRDLLLRLYYAICQNSMRRLR